jgi:uncharacterized protein
LNKEAKRLVKKLGLEEHPEGGYFKETYRAKTLVNVQGREDMRNIATAIYYMLADNQFSAFHRIRSDEIWHYYAGSSITLYAINDEGKFAKIRIGRGEAHQTVMKAGTWFAASLNRKYSYCLLGCTLSPGFDHRDWELGERDKLAKLYPQYNNIIKRYTK